MFAIYVFYVQKKKQWLQREDIKTLPSVQTVFNVVIIHI